MKETETNQKYPRKSCFSQLSERVGFTMPHTSIVINRKHLLLGAFRKPFQKILLYYMVLPKTGIKVVYKMTWHKHVLRLIPKGDDSPICLSLSQQKKHLTNYILPAAPPPPPGLQTAITTKVPLHAVEEL